MDGNRGRGSGGRSDGAASSGIGLTAAAASVLATVEAAVSVGVSAPGDAGGVPGGHHPSPAAYGSSREAAAERGTLGAIGVYSPARSATVPRPMSARRRRAGATAVGPIAPAEDRKPRGMPAGGAVLGRWGQDAG